MLSGLLLLGLLPLALLGDAVGLFSSEDSGEDGGVPADSTAGPDDGHTGAGDDFLDLVGTNGDDSQPPDDPTSPDDPDKGDDQVGGEGGVDDAIATGDGTVFVVGGDSYVFGGKGDDTIQLGEGAAAVFGDDGADQIYGCDGNETYIDGGAGNDFLQGGDADEVIMGGVHVEGTGENDDDVIDGGGGDDDIRGGLGADFLSGGDGNDVINHKGVAAENAGIEGDSFSWHIDGEADILNGGAGNDTLIFDSADVATGGEGADEFLLYSSGDGSFAQVTDFNPGEDLLSVQLNPDFMGREVVLDVQPSADGADGVVTVNGEVIAVLRGTPGATVADVYVNVSEGTIR
ncbi:calcium-binding protein [Aliiroseovarius sp.]|uniref:calcium-binding protein n=1 Tax=Aliiroseovarius sp. TaxID=1872442 RepID=UPI003BA92AA6